LEREWLGGVTGGPCVEDALVGVIGVVPLGAVGTTLPDGLPLGWVAVGLAPVVWAALEAELSVCDRAVSGSRLVALASDAEFEGSVPPAEGFAALPDGEAVLAGPLPGTPGMGSRAAGGMGPPANPTASRHAYPHKAATTAIVRRRHVLRRRPELSTKTGDDGAGPGTNPASSAISPLSGSSTPLDNPGLDGDVCTACDRPYRTVPRR
jgi:hypothetical protein